MIQELRSVWVIGYGKKMIEEKEKKIVLNLHYGRK